MLTKLLTVITLQYIHISSHYATHLKYSVTCQLYFSQKRYISPICSKEPPLAFPPPKRNLVPALSVGNSQPTLKKPGMGTRLQGQKACRSPRNEALVRKFSLLFQRLLLPTCIVTDTSKQQLQPMLRVSGPEVLTPTEVII